jgi:hypothetical protein
MKSWSNLIRFFHPSSTGASQSGGRIEFRSIGMKSSWQSLQKIDDPREHWNLASRTRRLERVILALVATSRYGDDASLQIDVIPSQRSGLAMPHSAPKHS